MKHEEKIREELSAANQRERFLSLNSYPRYLWHSLRESKLYRRAVRAWIGFRRYRLISRIITFVAALITLMGTGAAALLLALLCLLILPIFALLVGGTMLLGFFRRGWQNEQLRGEITHRTVYLFFPSELREDSFSAHNMRSFAQAPQATVFIVSPYSWSAAGLGGKGFYINARREGEHLFLIRRHYFFFFRRLLNTQEHQRIVVIL